METTPIPGTLSDPLTGKAERARELFCQIKGNRASGNYARQHIRQNSYTDRNSNKAFYAVAELCTKQNWDVEMYVRTAFDTIKRSNNYIRPADLLLANVHGAYALKVVCKTLEADPRVRYNYQVRDLLNYYAQQTGLKTEAEILMSPITPFAPWFRVLYPEHVTEEMLGIYGDLAHNELKEDRLLRLFARKSFPRNVAVLEQRYGILGGPEEVFNAGK